MEDIPLWAKPIVWIDENDLYHKWYVKVWLLALLKVADWCGYIQDDNFNFHRSPRP